MIKVIKKWYNKPSLPLWFFMFRHGTPSEPQDVAPQIAEWLANGKTVYIWADDKPARISLIGEEVKVDILEKHEYRIR